MKNKKGFTFVELIAVITIIGILTLIALPTIERLTKENKEKVYQQQLDNIVLSLKSWASDNRIYLPAEENEILTITLGNLKSEGYIESEVKNPLTGKCFDNSMALIITKVKKSYDYAINLDTIKESENCEINLNSPVIAINGNMIENIEVNSVYIDKGVIAKDKDGNKITDDVVTTISGSGNVVDTSKIGNQYIITYSVTNDDVTIQASRTIKIVDTKAPNLVIPKDIVINASVTSLNIMDGVSAKDNSNENIEVITKGSVDFGVAGKYTITYTATDSSGNVTTKKRMISVVLYDFSNGIMKSNNECILSSSDVCPNGTKINVQVNNNDDYDFYVIADTGTKLTLIMDKNFGHKVAWYKDNDDSTNDEKNNLGPITALEYLNSQTSNWGNIKIIKNYTYDNNLNGATNVYGYQKLEIDNGIVKLVDKDGTVETKISGLSRARLLTYEEAKALGCTTSADSCPTWMCSSKSTNFSYWTSTAHAIGDDVAWGVCDDSGNLNFSFVHFGGLRRIRPVIELSK